MFSTKIIVENLKREFKEVEKQQLPFATMVALNRTMFRIRDEGWTDEMGRVFDRPTRFTLRAVLYKRATKQRLVAEVFLRNDASGGTPPSKYLFPQVAGGKRVAKAFERSLARAGVPATFFVPGRQTPLDSSGNIPGSFIRKIQSQLQAAESVAGFAANQSQRTKNRLLRKQRKRGGGGVYFVLKQNRGKLKKGAVYERIVTGFGSAVRTVLHPLFTAPTYKVRFEPTRLSNRLFDLYFPIEFERALRQAVRTAR